MDNTATERLRTFYYGRRKLVHYTRTAQPSYSEEALTPADFLDPREGDEFVHGPRHAEDVRHLFAIFRHLYRTNPLVAVFSNAKLLWDVEGLPQPAPDVVVIPGVEALDSVPATFDVRAADQRPAFVLEVVSPRLAAGDLEDKVAIYAQAGVREYFIVDSGEREETHNIAYAVLGYRLQKGDYQPIAPDEQGSLYSEVNRVWIGPDQARQRVVVTSAQSGEELLPDEEGVASPAALRAEATFRATSIAAQLNFLRGE
ncbi:MAG: Uma2 family endonuclease [Caldilineaceae bacterium]